MQPTHPQMAASEKHQYAMDADGNWVHAIDGRKGVAYFCDCPERHPLKLVPPSGLEGKRPFSDYFAHYGGSICMHGGESMKHRLAKHRLRELAPRLTFTVQRCRLCGCSRDFQSDGHTVQLEVRSKDKRWQYDTVLFNRAMAAVCALEVVNTHYSSQEKIDSTRRDMGFAEFMVDDVLESTDGLLDNIRTLDYPDCPRCQERRLAIAAEKERLKIAAEKEAAAAESRRIMFNERRLALVAKLKKRRLAARSKKTRPELTLEQMLEWCQFRDDYLKNKKSPCSKSDGGGKWKKTANGWRCR